MEASGVFVLCSCPQFPFGIIWAVFRILRRIGFKDVGQILNLMVVCSINARFVTVITRRRIFTNVGGQIRMFNIQVARTTSTRAHTQ